MITAQHEIAVANLAPNYCMLDVLYRDYSVAEYCGTWGWYEQNSKTYKPFYCNSLKCGRERCQKAAYFKRVKEVQHAIDEHGLDKFFTLTLDRKTIPDGVSAWKHIAYVWNRFRTKVKREYGKFDYIAILEAHKDSKFPHIHGFTSTYIHVTDWSRLWESCGGGKIVWVEKVKDDGASSYVGKTLNVAKYVGKDNMVNAYQCKPFRGRTIWRSRGVTKPVKKDVDKPEKWCILKVKVFDGNENMLDDWGGIDDGKNELVRENLEGTFEDVSKEGFRASKSNMEAQENQTSRREKAKDVARATSQDKWGHQENNRRIEVWLEQLQAVDHCRGYTRRVEGFTPSSLIEVRSVRLEI